jgi:hypothetical protein
MAVDLIHLAQDRDEWEALLNKLMNLRVPKNAGKFLSCSETSGSSRIQLHTVEYIKAIN